MRAELGIPPEAKRVIIFSQSSHLDWDWEKSFEGYYSAFVESIFSSAQHLLTSLPGYFYSIGETDFLERHLRSHPEQQSTMVAAAEQGRLRLVGGGMTSPDLILPTGEAILRNYHYGRDKLRGLLGERVYALHQPVAAWLPDDFGLSPVTPSLLREAGYRYVAFARLPGADSTMQVLGFAAPREGSVARQLLDNHWLDFIWQAPDGSQVIAHYLYPNYGIGDTLDSGVPIPGPAGSDLNGQNTTADYVNGQIRSYITTIGDASPTDYIFVPVGNDFQFPKPLLLSHLARWNSSEYAKTGVYAVAATFEHYARLVEFHRDRLPTMALDATPYWTGFYATKPELKTLHQQADFLIRAAEAARALVPPTVSQDQLDDLWRQVVPSTHHDYLTGTAKDDVYMTEQLPLLQGAVSAAQEALTKLQAAVAQQIDTSGPGLPVVVFNHLGESQSGVVEVKAVPTGGAKPLIAVDPDGLTGDVQVLAESNGRADLLLTAMNVPAHGYKVYQLKSGTQSSAGVVAEMLEDGKVRLSNGLAELTFCEAEICSLRADGHELLASMGKANQLVFYYDEGGLYRLGAELSQAGCKYAEANPGETTAGELTIVESGPVRATVRVTKRVAGFDFVREISLGSGERMVRFRTSGTAPEHYTVTARFDLAAQHATAEMGAPYGIVHRGLSGDWKELYHPAQVFFAPLAADDTARAAFSAIGPLAWKAERTGQVEYILLRDVRSEQCESYGMSGKDDSAHRVDYAIYFPGRPETTLSRALPGYQFQHPLQAQAAAVHGGPLPKSNGWFEVLDRGALVNSATLVGGHLVLRIFRIDRRLQSTLLRPGKVSFRNAYLTDAAWSAREKLTVSDGVITVPLAHDLVTVLLE